MAPNRGQDVDAGQGTLLLGNILLVAYLTESSINWSNIGTE